MVCYIFCYSNTHKKNVEPVCRSFHEVKALALPRLSKRATRKPHEDDTKTSTEILSSGKVLQTTSRGVPVALFLTICLNLRDSYFVKTKAYSYALFICMSNALRQCGRTNIQLFYFSPLLLHKKKTFCIKFST